MNYFFETYGCQMNSAESAALALACRERGWTRAADDEDADLVLLNTCSVRLTAEQRALGRIARYAGLKKKRLAAGRPFTLRGPADGGTAQNPLPRSGLCDGYCGPLDVSPHS